MQPTNNIAFKEWSVVCEALGIGRQIIILRKGGIDEGSEGFRVKHKEFWLLPTKFHQDASQLRADAHSLLDQALATQPPAGKFRVSLYAVVQSVFEIRDATLLDRLAAEHILSCETIAKRFNYRHPGLYVLLIRTFRIRDPYIVSDSPYIAGCKSWVELVESLSTAGAEPVMNDNAFAERAAHISSLLGRAL